jgi:hypothetical protein
VKETIALLNALELRYREAITYYVEQTGDTQFNQMIQGSRANLGAQIIQESAIHVSVRTYCEIVKARHMIE